MRAKTLTFAALATTLLAPVALFASELHPIVDFQAGYLLGSGAVNDKWLGTESLAKSKILPGQKKYRVYSANRYLGEVTGAKAISQGPPCEDTRFVEFSSASKTKCKTGEIAIAGSWNALPRVPRQESTAQTTYRNVVSNLLKTKGITKPTVRIAQVLRVDLEGDGVAEVLINATNHNGSNGLDGNISSNSRAGEYSMILLRKIVKGKVQTTLVEGSFYPRAKEFNAPGVFKIAGAFDVNGDGKMEIVLKGRYYEGDWTTVYAVEGNKSSSVLKVREVLSDGCGA
ncbi:hypothetical protein IAD21_00749 [Abditibacteriota bacterium]|nr:hypothetical protein IAD21_00749 [Abditibacteriota bacterium]